MNKKIALASLTLVVLIGAVMYTESASSRSSNPPPAIVAVPNFMPAYATILSVDRTDDTAAASACTGAANDCSLRGAIIRANSNPGADVVIVNLLPATTYNLTLANAVQENASATGDLDITTSLHAVIIVGGGSAGANATT